MAKTYPHVHASPQEKADMEKLFNRKLASNEANGLKILKEMSTSDKAFHILSTGPTRKVITRPPSQPYRLPRPEKAAQTPEEHYQYDINDKALREHWTNILDTAIDHFSAPQFGADRRGVQKDPAAFKTMTDDLGYLGTSKHPVQLSDLIRMRNSIAGLDTEFYLNTGKGAPISWRQVPYIRGAFKEAVPYEDITEKYHTGYYYEGGKRKRITSIKEVVNKKTGKTKEVKMTPDEALKAYRERVEAHPGFKPVKKGTRRLKDPKTGIWKEVPQIHTSSVRGADGKYVKLQTVVLLDTHKRTKSSAEGTETKPVAPHYTLEDIASYAATQKNVRDKGKKAKIPKFMVTKDGEAIPFGGKTASGAVRYMFPTNLRAHLETILYGEDYKGSGNPYGYMDSGTPLGPIMAAYLAIQPPPPDAPAGKGWRLSSSVTVGQVVWAMASGQIPGIYAHKGTRYGGKLAPPELTANSEAALKSAAALKREKLGTGTEASRLNIVTQTAADPTGGMNIDPYSDPAIIKLITKAINIHFKGKQYKDLTPNERKVIDKYEAVKGVSVEKSVSKLIASKRGSVAQIMQSLPVDQAATILGLSGQEVPNMAEALSWELGQYFFGTADPSITPDWKDVAPGQCEQFLFDYQRTQEKLHTEASLESAGKRGGGIEKKKTPSIVREQYPSQTRFGLPPTEKELEKAKGESYLSKTRDKLASVAFDVDKAVAGKKGRVDVDMDVREGVMPADMATFTLIDLALFMMAKPFQDENLWYETPVLEGGRRTRGSPGKGFLLAYNSDGKLVRRTMIQAKAVKGSKTTRVVNKKGVTEAKNAAKKGEGVYTLREDNDENYGNPWSAKKIKGTIKVDTVQEAVKNYENWLRKKDHKDVETARRDWILEQIEDGELSKPSTLIYYTEISKKDGGVSHADVLAFLTNEFNGFEPPRIEVSTDTVLDEAFKFLEEDILDSNRLDEIRSDMLALVDDDSNKVFSDKKEVDAYIKSHGGVVTSYYKALLEVQASTNRRVEKENSYTSDSGGESRVNYKKKKGSSYMVFGEPPPVNPRQPKNISDWGTRAKVMALVSEISRLKVISRELVDGFNRGVYEYQELVTQTAEKMASIESAEESLSVKTGTEVSGVAPISDAIKEKRLYQLKKRRDVQIQKDAEVGVMEDFHSTFVEPVPTPVAVTPGHTVEEMAFLDFNGVSDISAFIANTAKPQEFNKPTKKGRKRTPKISKPYTVKEVQEMAKVFWHGDKNANPEILPHMSEKEKAQFKDAVERKGGIVHHLGSDSVVSAWDASLPGLGSDPTSYYSQYAFLTSDAWADNVEKILAAGRRAGARADKWIESTTGKSLSDRAPYLKMKFSTQFYPFRALAERSAKALNLDADHALVQDLNIFADMMAYHGKGAESLFDAQKRYYEFLSEKLVEFGVEPIEFGEYVQATSAPLRNRAGAFRLKADYKKYKDDVKRLGGILKTLPTMDQINEAIEKVDAEIAAQEKKISKAKRDGESDKNIKGYKDALGGMMADKKNLHKEKSLRKVSESDLKHAEDNMEDVNPERFERDGEIVYTGISTEEAESTLKRLLAKPAIRKMVADGEIFERYYEMNMDTLFNSWNSGMTNVENTIRMSLLNTRAPNIKGKLAPLVKAGILVDDTEGNASKYKSEVLRHLKAMEEGGMKPSVERDEEFRLSWWSAALTLEHKIAMTKAKREAGLTGLEAETVDVLKLGLDKIDQHELAKKHNGVFLYQGGYQYTPFVGFLGETSEYERSERLSQAAGETSTNKGRGWDAPSGPAVYATKGRPGEDERGNLVKPPDPRLTMPQAFQAHSEAVIWNLKSEVRGSIVQFHTLLKDLHEAFENGFSKKWQDGLKKEYPEWFGDEKSAERFEQHAEYLYEELGGIFELEEAEEAEYYQVLTSTTENSIGETVEKLPLMGRRKVLRKLDNKQDKLSLTHMINGKPYIVRFKETEKGEMFARALKNLKYQQMHPLLKLINPITRLMARAFTSWNPEFMLNNLLRDMQGAFLNLSEDKKKEFAKRVANFKNVSKAIKHIYSHEKAMDALRGVTSKKELKGVLAEFESLKGEKREAFLNDTTKMMQIFTLAGGKTGFFKFKTTTEMMKDFEGMVEPSKLSKKSFFPKAWGGGGNLFKGSKPNVAVKFVKKIGNFVDNSNSAIENSVRLLSFTEALRYGMTLKDAVQVARNVTVDFNKKGEYGSGMGALYLFFNAGLQGNIRVMRSIMNRGGKDGLNLILLIMAASASNAFFNRLMAPRDDEEDRSEFDNLGDWERDSHMVFYLPGGSHLKFPIPWGYSLFWAMGQRLADVISGPPEKSLMSLTTSFLSNVNNQLNPWGSGSAPYGVGAILPSAVEPLVQALRNQKFYGAPIEREDMDFAAPTPAAYRNMPGTHPFYAKIAELSNSLLGGDHVTQGSLRNLISTSKLDHPLDDDISPLMSGSMLEHFVEGYLAGPMKTLLDGAYGVGGLVFGSVPEVKDVPIARKFVVSKTSNWITTIRFHDRRKRVMTANEYVKDLKRNKNPEESREGMKNNRKLLKAKAFVDAADTERKRLVRLENDIKRSRMSADKKEAETEKIRVARDKATRRALAKARSLGIIA